MTRGLSFGPAADLYDAIRPTYPPEAVRWALGDARRVVDLGAGTGILTRVLLGLGYDVIAVEPDPAMRAKLAATTPGVAPVDGRAEAVPVPDGSVDAVVAGQAYHWFDQDAAHAEAARVLTSGGVLAPVWNVRDHDVPWVRQLTAIAEDVRDHDGGVFNGEVEHDFGPQFGPVERARFRHEVPMTADRLVLLVASRSYYITAPPDKQTEIKTKVRTLAATLPQRFTMPYVTVAYRATRCARR